METGRSQDLHRLESLCQTVAHELRTPLAIAHTAALTLLSHAVDPEEHERLLDMVARNTEVALAVVHQLRLIPQLAEEQLPLERSRVDLAEVARESVRDFSLLMRDGRHPLEVEGTSLIVEANPTALRQILFNLLDNAARYSPPGTPISVQLHDATDGQVAIVVHDRGGGISDDDRDRIFEAFETGDSTRGGTGLGLFISRGLARAHGGELEVRPGKQGTDFVLRLPRTSPADLQDRHARPAKHTGAPPTG